MPTKRISFARYRRVLQIIQDDPLLKRELSKKTVAINCGGQKFEDVPQEAVYVTQSISDDGIDPYTMPKVDVVNKAYDLLIAKTRPDPLLPEETKLKAMEAAAAKPATNGHVKAPKVKKLEPSRTEVKPQAEKPKVEKPKAEKPKAEKPKAEKPPAPPPAPPEKPKPVVKARVPSPKAKATTASPAVVEPVKPGVNGVAAEPAKYLLPFTPPPPGQALEILPGVPRVSGIAALNLVYAALNVFEPFLAEEGVKDLCDELTVWINKVHRLTILPSVEEKPAAG